MAVETHVLDDDCETITGWGRTAPTLARVNRPRTHAEAAEAVRTAGARGSIAPGLGRASGDAAQNAPPSTPGPSSPRTSPSRLGLKPDPISRSLT